MIRGREGKPLGSSKMEAKGREKAKKREARRVRRCRKVKEDKGEK